MQPLSRVASSRAIQPPVRERSRVGMKISSWCQACPWNPGGLTKSMDCMHFTSGPMRRDSTPARPAWRTPRSSITGETLWGWWMHRKPRSTSSSVRPAGIGSRFGWGYSPRQTRRASARSTSTSSGLTSPGTTR